MLKKSMVLKSIRREMEAGNIYSIAVKRAGVRSLNTIDVWRKRKMIENYIQILMTKCGEFKNNAMEDAHFKSGINGNVNAQINYLCNRMPHRWKKDAEFKLDQSQHTHLTKITNNEPSFVINPVSPVNRLVKINE